ncbi:SMP-30/gluconolactonase/LRE family protein [Tuwongella immobilis]|uniref:SMP-30/Gluconolactonase/LRE-like region domain-containing protein n=1 Tax=Tuwongella immobilis TaxID=692036 RepID=A0A6C2YLC3_9BACT|nr:SMP-30/gluconolactonase/LRE family protein [Tuwongella immobilis]VIP02226.1 gluconolactonase : Gluconolactonase OS=Flavobacterium sp. F52 GN=FF52_17768 PE=4 SV=1: SGL [Tuwongella immobilis]VTS00765.1 gluconolactonase : Gluconolactonase OS=Flavobacterium sp. F52 GN=FF52_17768 PE=4 SV=1: SGL [Tuwongella immobilis]
MMGRRCRWMGLLLGCVGLLLLTPSLQAEDAFPSQVTVRKLADGFAFTEGPTPDAQGNVYFTDQPNDRILKWSIDGKLSDWLKPAGRSNGLYIDGEGMLWACADEKNQLWKIDPTTKQVTVVVNDFQGKLLNGPNDLWVRPTGGIYFTDPYYQRPWWTHKQPPQAKRAVYYRSPKGELSVVDDSLVQPNGIIGTPDGKTLYVADINARKTYSYTIQPDGKLTNKKLFCQPGSDGMTIDSAGNVYLTSGKVLVFNSAGTKIGEITVPESPANVCFGGKEGKTLFITARKGFYAVDLPFGRVKP